MIIIYIIYSYFNKKNEENDDVDIMDDSVRNHLYPSPDLADKISEIKTKDPNFNENNLLDKISTLFMKIQDARSKRDIKLMRAYVSEELYKRFDMQLGEMEKNKRYNKIEGLSIDNTRILNISIDENYDRIKVLILASWKDIIIDDAWKILEWENNTISWKEIWEFIRSANVKTDVNKSVFNDKCPNCWAPLDINNVWECNYCHSSIIKWEFDWVLSRIEQV